MADKNAACNFDYFDDVLSTNAGKYTTPDEHTDVREVKE